MTKQTTTTAADALHGAIVTQMFADVVTTVAGIGTHALDQLPTHELHILMGAPLDLHLEAADFEMENA